MKRKKGINRNLFQRNQILWMKSIEWILLVNSIPKITKKTNCILSHWTIPINSEYLSYCSYSRTKKQIGQNKTVFSRKLTWMLHHSRKTGMAHQSRKTQMGILLTWQKRSPIQNFYLLLTNTKIRAVKLVDKAISTKLIQ